MLASMLTVTHVTGRILVLALVSATLSATLPSPTLLAAPTRDAAVGSRNWPLKPEPEVRRGFDPPLRVWGRGHRGVDLAATVGQPVFAVTDGSVRYAGQLAGRGVVSIAHTGGRRTTYEPVRPSVQEGKRVSAGDRIGVVGPEPGHCVPATCLHWGLLDGARYRNPLDLLGRGPIRLLPVWRFPPPRGGWSTASPAGEGAHAGHGAGRRLPGVRSG